MGRCVAQVRFADGHVLYGVYCTTTDMVVGRALFDTPELASSARDAHEEAREGRGTSVLFDKAPSGAEATQESATIFPYWQYEDFSFEVPTRASRRYRWLTGPKGLDDVSLEERGQAGLTAPQPRINR